MLPAHSAAFWPYLPTLVRLGLALALGIFVGLERERRGKEAGVRTFAFAALLGCLLVRWIPGPWWNRAPPGPR